jgi:outer membrane protein assembly factor BamB
MTFFAVVPIFTNTAVAALPMIIAAITSVVALLFKPRELIRLCRRRPVLCGTTIGIITLSLLGATWLFAANPTVRKAVRGEEKTAIRIDWVKVAEDIIAQEHLAHASQGSRIGQTSTSKGDDITSNGTLSKNSGQSLDGEKPALDEGKPAAPLVFGRNYSRCSYGGGPSPLKLKPMWKFRPEDTLFLSSPLVAGKRVFIAGCQSDLGGYTGLLACVDADTGNPLWRITEIKEDLLLPFFSSPALTPDGKYLVIGQGLHTDRDCSLLCFDAATGQVRWSIKTTLHIESSPAIFGDVVVVGAGAIEGTDGKPVGDPGFVLAVRISDGKELWRQAVADPESSPAFDDGGMVYIGSGINGNAVLAIRSESKEELGRQKLDRIAWRTPMPLPITSPITLSGDFLIVGAGNGDFVHSNRNASGLVAALDRKSGEIRWQKTFDDAILGKICARDGTLLCPMRTGEVVALALADGSVLWRSRISGTAPVLAGCAATDKRIYAVSSDGFLAVLNPSNGAVLEKVYINDQAKPGAGLGTSSPDVTDGKVIVGSETGGLQCLVGAEGGK